MAPKPQSHNDNDRDGNPGFKSPLSAGKQLGKASQRRSARLQSRPNQFHRISAPIKNKSSLPLSVFHSNTIARIYRQSSHKNFPNLTREVEAQKQKLISAGKTLEDSDEEQSTYSTPAASPEDIDIDSLSEASESTLSAPSDTELFGLRAKSPTSTASSSSDSTNSTQTLVESPSLSPSSPSSRTSFALPSPSSSTSFVPPSRFASDG